MEESCKTCRFWLSKANDEFGHIIGDCRRYAPRIIGEVLGFRIPSTPETKPGDWCGEYQRQPAVEEGQV